MTRALFGVAIACSMLSWCGPHTGLAATFTTADGPVLVRNWGCQLQGGPPSGELSPGPLAAAPHDLLVVDFAREGDEASKFTPQEVDDIKRGKGGAGRRRVAVAYLSIGEASDSRSYWDAGWTESGKSDSPLQPAAPAWLGPVNHERPKSRKVRYWDPDWQAVIYNASGDGWLDQVVAQGFDAACLDIIVAYNFWSFEAQPEDKRPGDPVNVQDAARRMAEFVVDLTAHARQTNPHFFVIPQNGEFLLRDLSGPSSLPPADEALRSAYLESIGAIAIEDVYLRERALEGDPPQTGAAKTQVLKEDYLAAGIPVLVVDYVEEPRKVEEFVARARADGFTPYAAPRRELDTLAAPAASLPGDFNNDGAVGSDDQKLWRASYGSTTNLDADGNRDGVVNAEDYTLWRDANQEPVPATPEAALPVPAVAACLIVAAIAAILLAANVLKRS